MTPENSDADTESVANIEKNSEAGDEEGEDEEAEGSEEESVADQEMEEGNDEDAANQWNYDDGTVFKPTETVFDLHEGREDVQLIVYNLRHDPSIKVLCKVLHCSCKVLHCSCKVLHFRCKVLYCSCKVLNCNTNCKVLPCSYKVLHCRCTVLCCSCKVLHCSCKVLYCIFPHQSKRGNGMWRVSVADGRLYTDNVLLKDDDALIEKAKKALKPDNIYIVQFTFTTIIAKCVIGVEDFAIVSILY